MAKESPKPTPRPTPPPAPSRPHPVPSKPANGEHKRESIDHPCSPPPPVHKGRH